MVAIFARLLRDEGGATAIEYALIAVLISIAALAVFQLVGTNLTSIYNSVASDI